MRFQATHKLVTYLLVLVAFAALASTGAVTAAACGAFLLGWALSWPVDTGGRVAAALDRLATPLRLAMLVAFGAVAFQVWRRMPEPDLAPVLDLLLGALAYKLFHRRANRDYLQIYVLSFLLVLAASAQAGSALFAAAFALYVVLATWTLILFHLRREMEENYLVKHSAQAPSQKVGVTRILNSRRVVGGPFFVATGAVAAGVLLGAVATFTLIPRVGAGFVFGPPRASQNLIGFSDDVSLGQYGRLSADNPAVALRAVVPRLTALGNQPGGAAARETAVQSLYWRGTVYDRYDRGHWTRSRDPSLRTVLEDVGPHTLVREPAFEASAAAGRGAAAALLARADRQEIDVVGPSVPVVFALDRPVAVDFAPDGASSLRLTPRWSGELALHPAPPGHSGMASRPGHDPHGGLLPGFHGTTGSPPSGEGGAGDHGGDGGRAARAAGGLMPFNARYVAWSLDGQGRAAAGPAPAIAALPPAVRAAYLTVPGSLSERVPALARRLTEGRRSPIERVVALVDGVRSGHSYTLDLPRRPADVDPVEDFLFERTTGHCEFFASAAVVLLRAAGIPARYVNGYLGGEWNDIGGYVTVRDNRAHSWAEAYLDGIGWIRVDATPPGPAAARAGRLRQLLDSADFYWTRWVVGYDLDRQLDLARRLGRGLGLDGSGDGDGDGAWPARSGFRRWWLAVAAVALVGGIGLLASRRWPRLGRRRAPGDARRGRAAAGADAPVHRLYRRALRRLARAGMPRARAETPREYATRMSAAHASGSDVLDELTELYTAARFGGRPVEGDVLRDVARRLPRLGTSPE